jgi:hypothetical protein
VFRLDIGLQESLVRMFAGFDAGCLILLVRTACLLRYSRLRSDVLLLVYRVLLQPPWDLCSVVHGLYLRTGGKTPDLIKIICTDMVEHTASTCLWLEALAPLTPIHLN